jgi:hypothetical protein
MPSPTAKAASEQSDNRILSPFLLYSGSFTAGTTAISGWSAAAHPEATMIDDADRVRFLAGGLKIRYLGRSDSSAGELLRTTRSVFIPLLFGRTHMRTNIRDLSPGEVAPPLTLLENRI